MRFLATLIAATLLATAGQAGDIPPRDGWRVLQTDKPHAELLDALKTAVAQTGMAVVTQAGPTGAAKARGITIPENRVVGVFNNDFAVRILERSTAAMIEAPVRFYVTENPDGTATLSYKTPSFVFLPYTDEGGAALAALANDLDIIFDQIARAATE